ncbi:MAG: polymorphic toxin type 17 domain-containing protein [Actinomycetota bacterium]|nr:polymorphic toxin type 17 domain-containing protein [Actinomycetota bacterium]
MTARISGEPDRLEAYSRRTQAVIARQRESNAHYSQALNAFLAAQPNDLGDGGVPDRTATLETLVDGFEALDAKPAAFAFALRQLDDTGPGRLSTLDAELFGALTDARLDMPFAADEDVRDEAYRRTAETLQPEGALSIADLATLILDLAGIFDPTPVSDGASGVLSLFRGEWSQAGLSLAAAVPVVGDAGKLLKFKKTLKPFQHLKKAVGDLADVRNIWLSLKHIDRNNPGKVNEALGTMNRLAGDAGKRYKDTKVLEAARKRGLPTEGPVPFVPPERWDVKNPRTRPAQRRGEKRGIVDHYGNAWVWDPKKEEWDVQIQGSEKFKAFSRDGQHANISPDGRVTH